MAESEESEEPESDDATPAEETTASADWNALWIERLTATVLGAIPMDRWQGRSPYVFVLALYGLDYWVLATLQYFQSGFHPYLANPSIVLLPIGLVFAMWASRRLRDAYAEEVYPTLAEESGGAGTLQQGSQLVRAASRFFDLSIDTETPPERGLREFVPDRLKLVLLLVGWSFHTIWMVSTPGALEFILQTQGAAGVIRYFGFIPLVYYVVAVDFVSVFVGVVLLVPLKVRSYGIIDFEDPLGYGGLRPVGDLIKKGTILYFIGVATYIVFTGATRHFAAAVPELPPVTVLSLAGVTATIVGGVVLFTLPIIVIHGHMKDEKHEKIQALAAEVERYGPADDRHMFPETSIPDSVEYGQGYLQYFIKMTRVENTREYPIDVSHLQEIVLAGLVPYIAHVTVSLLATYLEAGGAH